MKWLVPNLELQTSTPLPLPIPMITIAIINSIVIIIIIDFAMLSNIIISDHTNGERPATVLDAVQMFNRNGSANVQ